ncbi:hypothetical protein AGLY_011705 [Aphis glycines]|uniref:Uncharacterized protein n=1 Tax=Aphis glycines TaxID=307491 RepID=A0A6G0TAZ2_APHGL|nr:hypothetical protein AGLY_011705 [Aphis glycines]
MNNNSVILRRNKIIPVRLFVIRITRAPPVRLRVAFDYRLYYDILYILTVMYNSNVKTTATQCIITFSRITNENNSDSRWIETVFTDFIVFALHVEFVFESVERKRFPRFDRSLTIFVKLPHPTLKHLKINIIKCRKSGGECSGSSGSGGGSGDGDGGHHNVFNNNNNNNNITHNRLAQICFNTFQTSVVGHMMSVSYTLLTVIVVDGAAAAAVALLFPVDRCFSASTSAAVPVATAAAS